MRIVMYNETYDDYIRSILGYPPMNTLNNNYEDYRIQNMNFNQSLEMNSTSDMDLENCYPEIYKIVYPMITKKCDNITMPVTKDDIENMTDEIYYALEERNEIKLNINLTNEVRKTEITNNRTKISDKKPEVKISETRNEKRETRQTNRNLRDLIQILLIRELLNRRRHGRPLMPGPAPRPPMRPPMRPPFGPGGTQFNRQFENLNYDIFEY